jgi:hypothetical protein
MLHAPPPSSGKAVDSLLPGSKPRPKLQQPRPARPDYLSLQSWEPETHGFFTWSNLNATTAWSVLNLSAIE